MAPDWIIEIDGAGYINECIEGSPGHTHDIQKAERYATENEARENMDAIRRKYPQRKYKIIQLSQ
jgi:hypothetical protein